MCLYTYQRKAKLAFEDIVVYKVLSEDLRSPIMYYYKYILNTIHVSGMDHTIVFSSYSNKGYVYSVEKGLHSFRNIFAARRLCKYQNKTNKRCKFYVYRAIIPAGSDYYIGDNNDIVSDRLIIKRKLWLNLF